MNVRRIIGRLLCWRDSHSWLTVQRVGGTMGLIYTRRTCVRCGLRQMRTSTGRWVEPFPLSEQWEQDDFESGVDYQV